MTARAKVRLALFVAGRHAIESLASLAAQRIVRDMPGNAAWIHVVGVPKACTWIARLYGGRQTALSGHNWASVVVSASKRVTRSKVTGSDVVQRGGRR